MTVPPPPDFLDDRVLRAVPRPPLPAGHPHDVRLDQAEGPQPEEGLQQPGVVAAAGGLDRRHIGGGLAAPGRRGSQRGLLKQGGGGEIIQNHHNL